MIRDFISQPKVDVIYCNLGQGNQIIVPGGGKVSKNIRNTKNSQSTIEILHRIIF